MWELGGCRIQQPFSEAREPEPKSKRSWPVSVEASASRNPLPPSPQLPPRLTVCPWQWTVTGCCGAYLPPVGQMGSESTTAEEDEPRKQGWTSS